MKNEIHFSNVYDCTKNEFLYRYFTKLLPKFSGVHWIPFWNFQKTCFNKCKGMMYGLCNVILRAIYKSRNRESSNGMRGMTGMLRIRVGMWVVRVEMMGMRWIRVVTRGIEGGNSDYGFWKCILLMASYQDTT